MVFPANLDTIVVRHKITDAAGRPLKGNTVTAEPAERVWATDGSIVQYRASTQIDADGQWELELPYVDQEGIRNKGVPWRVTEHVPGQPKSYFVAPVLAHGAGPIDAAECLVSAPTSRETVIQAGPVTDEAAASLLAQDGQFKAALTGTFVATDDRRIRRLAPGEDDQWRVRDEHGATAVAVDAQGNTRIGNTTHIEDTAGWRVTDAEGRIAFEVDPLGRTHIYDLATSGSGSSDVTTLHVFIAAGQSNMSGRGTPVTGPTSPRVMQYGANRRILEQAPLILDMVDTPSGTSPATFFAHHYLATQPAHVGVLIIPAARGGTGFAPAPAASWTWVKGAATDPQHGLYERSVEQTLDAIAAAQTAGYHVILKGVLWHQGEANGGLATEVYAGYLDTLIADYRADLDDPHLPFVLGQMCPEGMEDAPAKYTVDTAHQDTPRRVPRTGFAAATRDGHNPGDTTHFSTVGTAHLGDTYAAGYIQALGNVHPH